MYCGFLACESEWRDLRPVDVLIGTGATLIDVTLKEGIAPQFSILISEVRTPSVSSRNPGCKTKDFADSGCCSVSIYQLHFDELLIY
jgi:hypothetical protein